MDATVPLWIIAICTLIQTLAAVADHVRGIVFKETMRKLAEQLQAQVLVLLRQSETWANLGGFVAGALKATLTEEANGPADTGAEGNGKDQPGAAAGS